MRQSIQVSSELEAVLAADLFQIIELGERLKFPLEVHGQKAINVEGAKMSEAAE